MCRKIIKEYVERHFNDNSPFIIDEDASEFGEFDSESLLSNKTFLKRKAYCDQKYKKIGSGTSRIVYQLNDKYCLKLAKNKKGIAQNGAEISLSVSNASDIIAEIIDFDNDNELWVIMQLAKPLTPNSFHSILGISFEEYLIVLEFCFNPNKNNQRIVSLAKAKNPRIEELMDDDMSLFYRVADFCENYNVHNGDMKRLSSYGYVTDEDGENYIVLVDYGGTSEVIDTYYSK